MDAVGMKPGGGFLLACLLLVLQSPAHGAEIMNGSFETGDFTGWIATDFTGAFIPISVEEGGTLTELDFFAPNEVIPSDGKFAATHGFDGGDPLIPETAISIAQDIGVIAAGDLLTFDYRAGWDLITFSMPGDSDRTFEVLLEPEGGGMAAADAKFLILTAAIGTFTFNDSPNSDKGPQSEAIDLTRFAGMNARINFKWTIPDADTGPANAQLDNVAITSIIVPEPTTLLLVGLGLAGLGFGRRKLH